MVTIGAKMSDKEENKEVGFKRDEKGQFVKGGKGGPGAAGVPKFKRQFNTLLKDAVTEEDFTEVCQKLLECAKNGQPWAMQQLLDRLLGKPKQIVDMDVTQNTVDPKLVIENVSVLLGLDSKEEENHVIEITEQKPNEIE